VAGLQPWRLFRVASFSEIKIVAVKHQVDLIAVTALAVQHSYAVVSPLAQVGQDPRWLTHSSQKEADTPE